MSGAVLDVEIRRLDQPIGRERRDPGRPEFVLTDVDLALAASDGTHAKLTVTETVSAVSGSPSVLLLDLYDADTAERWGLVNEVVPPDELMDKAKEYARKIASYSPTALRFLKHSFNADSDHLGGIGNVAFAGLDLFVDTDEAKEGARAFAEKRPPDFAPFR